MYLCTSPQLSPLEMKNLVGSNDSDYKFNLLLIGFTSVSREGGTVTFPNKLQFVFFVTNCMISYFRINFYFKRRREEKYMGGRYQGKFCSPFSRAEVGCGFYFMVL